MTRKFSLAHRAKISAARRGQALSPAHKAKISAALKGRKKSPAHCAALSGRVLSPAHRANIAAAHRGKKKSAAHKAKISAALRGHPTSPAVRAKISLALRGRKRPASVMAPAVAARRGHPLSGAWKAKLSAAHRGPRNASYKHGIYAAPEPPPRTLDDWIRVLAERQARIAAVIDRPPAESGLTTSAWISLCGLYFQTLTRLCQLQMPRWKAEADEAAANAFFDSVWREIEEYEREKAEEEKQAP